jgi:hypothetical protein
MPDWNTAGKGGVNKPLHQKAGAPTRKPPPVASHGPNLPTHQRVKDGTPNKPLHQRVGSPTRSKPPLSGKGKTF